MVSHMFYLYLKKKYFGQGSRAESEHSRILPGAKSGLLVTKAGDENTGGNSDSLEICVAKIWLTDSVYFLRTSKYRSLHTVPVHT